MELQLALLIPLGSSTSNKVVLNYYGMPSPHKQMCCHFLSFFHVLVLSSSLCLFSLINTCLWVVVGMHGAHQALIHRCYATQCARCWCREKFEKDQRIFSHLFACLIMRPPSSFHLSRALRHADNSEKAPNVSLSTFCTANI